MADRTIKITFKCGAQEYSSILTETEAENFGAFDLGFWVQREFARVLQASRDAEQKSIDMIHPRGF